MMVRKLSTWSWWDHHGLTESRLEGRPEFSLGQRLDILTVFLDFAREFLWREIMMHAHYIHHPPAAFFALLKDDEAVRTRRMTTLRGIFQSVGYLENEAHDDQWVRAWLRDLLWPHQPFVREHMIGLSEAYLGNCPAVMRREMENIGKGPGGTKNIEDFFNVLRKAQKGQSLGVLAQWHRCVRCSVLEQAGLTQVPVQSRDRAASQSTIPAELFQTPPSCKASLGKDLVESYMGTKHWSAPSAQNYLRLPMMTAQLAQPGWDTEGLKATWCSVFAVEGSFIVHKDMVLDSACEWVLMSCERGLLTWPCTVEVHEGEQYINLSGAAGPECYKFVYLTDPGDYYVLSAKPCILKSNDAVGGVHAGGARFHVTAGGMMTVLEYSARRAFPGVTVAQMKRWLMQTRINWHDDVPSLEMAVAFQLIKQVLRCEDDEALQILQRRNAKKAHAFASSITKSLRGIAAEAVPPEERQAVETEIFKADKKMAKQDAKRQAAIKRARLVPASRPEEDAGGPRASGSGSGPPVAERGRISEGPRAIVGEQFTVEEAKVYLPDYPGVWIHIKGARCWLVKFDKRARGFKSHMATWSDGGRTHKECLLECLRWVWQVYRAEVPDGRPCPWDLS